MATVEQLDREIAQKDEELLPLTKAAEAAQERCLERFAAALGPMMSQYARRSAADEADVTEALRTSGRLSGLKSIVRSLESESRELVEKCLRSSGPWTHVDPEAHRWSIAFPSTPVTGPGKLSSGWRDSLTCLARPLASALKTHGYQRASFYLTNMEWPPDVLEALRAYGDSTERFMRVWNERGELRRDRAKVAAENAWDSVEGD
jgi:hypothetical protein